MKKFNKYLFCICLFIISMFIFSNDIKAWSDSDYANFNYNSDFVQEKMFQYKDFIDFMDSNLIPILESEPYDYVIYFSDYNNEYYYTIIQKYDSSIPFYMRSYFNSGVVSGFELENINNENSFRHFSYSYSDYISNTYNSDNLYSYIDNLEFYTRGMTDVFELELQPVFYSISSIPITIDMYDDSHSVCLIYRSSSDIFLTYASGSSSYFLSPIYNGDLSTRGEIDDKFLTYYDVMLNPVNISIEMTKTFANDLEGNEIYNIRVDFENVFDVNYKYQVRNEYEEWQDVTSNVLDAYQYGYYYYDYTLRFNSKVYARVLDSNDNVIATNEIEVTELNQISFNEIVSTEKYSRVEFEFTIPTSSYCDSSNSDNSGFDIPCYLTYLNYNIRNVTKNGLDNTLTFGIPYLEKEYFYDTGSSSVAKTDIIPLSDITNFIYSGSYKIIEDITMTKLKLVVPLDYIVASYVKISFNSTLEYSVNYIERSDEHIGSVDITGKAGVMFIPKQITEDMLVGFNFHPTATYSLQLRDTYESNYNVLDYYSIGYCDDRDYANVGTNVCNNGTNGYQAYINFKKGELKQSIFIINRDYYEYQDKEKQAIVYYDTRYFEYVIYDEITSTPTFKHPITNEEITLDDLTDYDSYYTNEVHTSFFTIFSNAFNEFRSDILKIFSYINELWNGLPSVLRYFYIVIFSLILFIFLFKFIL